MRWGRRNGQRGFSLMELLMVVAIIAILAAIVIPNLLLAINRSKQKRTIVDIRAIAMAWESRAIDNNSYLVAAATFAWPEISVPYADLRLALAPHYVGKVPEFDGWSTPYDTACSARGDIYAIRSAGYDREFDSDTYSTGMATSFECDIVFSQGYFVVYPQASMSAQ